MSSYIDREAVDDMIYDYSRSCDVNYGQLSERLYAIPSADVRPNIHGHWEPKYPTREETIYCQERYFCSNCKGYVVDRVARLEFNFCPNCGADMRGDT